MDAATVTETTQTTPTIETPAPAAPAAAEDTRGAAFRAFDAEKTAADLARFKGEPPPATAKPVEPAKPAENDDDQPAVDATGQQIRDAKGQYVSKRRQREQDEQNERVRQAVERGTAEERQKRETLERRLAELEARSAPAAKPAEPPKAPDGPPKPRWKDFEGQIGTKFQDWGEAQEAYDDARDAWRDEQAERQAKQQQETEAKTAAQKDAETRVSTFYERERAFAKDHADYGEKTRELRAALNPDNVLTQALLESEHAAALLYAHQADLRRIGALGLTNLPAALRELGKLEATLESAAAAAPAIPLKKTVSDAPEPPTALGTRSAEPANASHAAVASKDFRAFDELETSKALARFGRR